MRNQWLDLSSGRADVVEVPVENPHQAQQEHQNVVQSGECDLLALSVARAGISRKTRSARPLHWRWIARRSIT